MPPHHPLRLREYTAADRQACLAIFDSNVPIFFKEHERPEFEDFLNRLPCPYFVVEDAAGKIIGCGGYAAEGGRMVFGLVTRELHRQGVGRFLLQARLRWLYENHGPKMVTLSTSNESEGFFAREGFTTTRIIPDGWAPGLHRHDMELELNEAAYGELCARLERR